VEAYHCSRRETAWKFSARVRPFTRRMAWSAARKQIYWRSRRNLERIFDVGILPGVDVSFFRDHLGHRRVWPIAEARAIATACAAQACHAFAVRHHSKRNPSNRGESADAEPERLAFRQRANFTVLVLSRADRKSTTRAFGKGRPRVFRRCRGPGQSTPACLRLRRRRLHKARFCLEFAGRGTEAVFKLVRTSDQEAR